MKKRLILTSTLLIASAVTAMLWTENGNAKTDLLAANVEALSWGEYPGLECGQPNLYPNSMLEKAQGTITETKECIMDGFLTYSKGTLQNKKYIKGHYYTIVYETTYCAPYQGYCCDASQAGSLIIDDGVSH